MTQTVSQMKTFRAAVDRLQDWRKLLGVGYRDCFVVGETVQDGETRILFKSVEYDHPPQLKLLGDLVTATVRQDPNPAEQASENSAVDWRNEQFLKSCVLWRAKIEAGGNFYEWSMAGNFLVEPARQQV